MLKFPTNAHELLEEIKIQLGPCRKKPLTVHALQINKAFTVASLEGEMEGKAGDFLMCGVNNELYICDQQIFKQTYDWMPTN